MGCSLGNMAGCLGDGVSAVLDGTLETLATAVMEAFGKSITSLGTVWVNIGTPNLLETGEVTPLRPGSAAEGTANITEVLGYVKWIGLAVAVLSLFALGALIATRMRSGEGVLAVGKLGLVLGAVVLISGAGALVGALLPAAPERAGTGTAAFLQSRLWWYTGALAVLSVMIGGARMVWEQRAEPGRDTVKGLLTLVVVAGSSVTIGTLLITAADSFSIWIINESLRCDVTAPGSACFGENMLGLLALSTTGAATGLGPLLLIILGLVAMLAAAFQIVLMVARAGMLVILTGILPLSASFTNTEMGRTWFKKCIAWLVAFILYKPAAAVVYAAAFQLSGTNVFTDDGTGLLAVLTGLMLMVLALFAMPALMRFVTPMVGAMSGGGGGAALAAGALAALPTGAAALGRLGSRSADQGQSAGRGGGNDGRPGPAGNEGPSGSGHSSGGGGSQQNAGAKPTTQGPGASGAGGGGAGSTGGGAAASAGTASGGAASGAAASGASAGAAAGGATAAGAAAGPAGIAAGAALDAAKGAGQAAMGAVRQVAHDSTGEGEGGGPDGSR